LAWQEFRRGKQHKLDVLAFERHLEDGIVALRHDLSAGAYRHGPYEHFVVHDPKHREISKATVRDRLVHHALVRALEPAFEQQLTDCSWSCRRGKGTHAAVDYFQHCAWRLSRNSTRTVWVLKLDIRHFFASTNHEILRSVLWRTIQDQRVRWLVAEIIESFPEGLPLGNLTSQLFANVYLNELDCYIKNVLKVPGYLRYCDDLIFWHADQQFLVNLLPIVRAYLADELRLRLHPRKVLLTRYHAGVDVLGYLCFPHYKLLRTTTARRLLQRYDARSAPSYDGVLQHCRSRALRRRLPDAGTPARITR